MYLPMDYGLGLSFKHVVRPELFFKQEILSKHEHNYGVKGIIYATSV